MEPKSKFFCQRRIFDVGGRAICYNKNMLRKIFILAVLLVSLVLCWQYYLHWKDELGRQLVADAYDGNLLAVKEDIEAGAPLFYEFYFNDDDREYTRQTFNALHAAASSGNEDVISFLLEQGMNIDYPTPNGWTPLFIAARDGQAEAAKLLVFYKADLNAQTDLGASALLMVLTQPFETEKARKDLLSYMLKRGADVNLLTSENHSPLYYALLEEKPELAEMLCTFGAHLTDAEKTKLTDEEKDAFGLSAGQRETCGF